MYSVIICSIFNTITLTITTCINNNKGVRTLHKGSAEAHNCWDCLVCWHLHTKGDNSWGKMALTDKIHNVTKNHLENV